MSYIVVERGARDQLGEGPVWSQRRGELLWVDILGSTVHRMSLSDRRIRSLKLEGTIGWVLPRAGSNEFIAGFRNGFYSIDLDSGELRPIGHPEPDRVGNRMNDAKVDPAGRIWAGTKDDADKNAGALYRLDCDLTWRRMDDGYQVTNGPAFSRDGKTLYHTDSARRSIYAFDLDEEGAISGKRVWLEFLDEWGFPDGMTTDVEGCLWVAHWGGGRVSRFSPAGELIRSVALPAPNITSCTFAGERLDRLFVTSSSIDSADQPLAGALFEIDPGISGIPQPEFGG